MPETTKCYNCETNTISPMNVKIGVYETYFCPACYAAAKKAHPSPVTFITKDAQYCQLRDHRNRERDRIERDHVRETIKHLDAPLELYERKMGTDYCSVLYHNHQFGHE